jgi:hypothetical protein
MTARPLDKNFYGIHETNTLVTVKIQVIMAYRVANKTRVRLCTRQE